MLETNASLSSVSPMYIVQDLDETVAFYRDRLGFAVSFVDPYDDPFFAIVTRDGVGLFLKRIGDDVAPMPNPQRHPWAKWDAFISTEQPDELADEVGRRSGVRCVADDTEEGLRGFVVTDPNGYVLFFGRPIPG